MDCPPSFFHALPRSPASSIPAGSSGRCSGTTRRPGALTHNAGADTGLTLTVRGAAGSCNRESGHPDATTTPPQRAPTRPLRVQRLAHAMQARPDGVPGITGSRRTRRCHRSAHSRRSSANCRLPGNSRRYSRTGRSRRCKHSGRRSRCWTGTEYPCCKPHPRGARCRSGTCIRWGRSRSSPEWGRPKGSSGRRCPGRWS
jgi:hypothetical protein